MPGDAQPTVTVKERLDPHEEYRREFERLEAQREKMRTRRHAEAESRRAAGMGFWRLVCIVSIGILIAQAIGAAILFLARAFSGL